MNRKQDIYMDVCNVTAAHRYVLKPPRGGAYLNGRGHYGVILPVKGGAQYVFEAGEQLTLHEGEILFLHPRAAYSIRLSSDFVHYTVNFDIREESSSPIFGEGFHILLKPDSLSPYLTLLGELSALRLCGGDRMREVGYVYELLSLLFRELSVEKQDKNVYKRIAHAKCYIEEHYTEEIDVSRLAALADMSPTNFRREWRRLFGETAMQYRDRLRVALAKEHLSCGHNVSETADICGFADANYFIRFFKKHVGLSPRAYQKQI